MKHNKALLAENGGEINLTKHWAASLLGRMNYVKRRGTTNLVAFQKNLMKSKSNLCRTF